MISDYFEQQLQLGPSVCDASGRLSYAGTFGIFMDIASIHAEQLGVGLRAMAAQSLFWLTVKTQICFAGRPGMMDSVTLATWPEKPDRMRANRSYTLTRSGQTLITGKTEWAVMNTKTQRLTPVETVYPQGLVFTRDGVCPDAFAQIPDTFDAGNICAQERVRPTDIDVGGHMNNAAYLHLLFSTFSNEELRAMRIRKIDAIFRAPCFEGELLRLEKRGTDDGLELRLSKADAQKPAGQTVFLAKITRQDVPG